MKVMIKEGISRRLSLLQGWQGTEQLECAIVMLVDALRQGHSILAFGNGGSATQASHFAAELVNKYYRKRPALAALALSTDMAAITAIANDGDFSRIFARQIEALGREGDVALALTTSGQSVNVLQALSLAKQKGMLTIVLCGKVSQALAELRPDLILSVDCEDTPLIQEFHLFILHSMAEMLEERFSGEEHVPVSSREGKHA